MTTIRRCTVAIIAVVLLGGCGGGDPVPVSPSTDASIRVEHVTVDGRPVPCILWDAPGNGGLAMSCNWPTETTR